MSESTDSSSSQEDGSTEEEETPNHFEQENKDSKDSESDDDDGRIDATEEGNTDETNSTPDQIHPRGLKHRLDADCNDSGSEIPTKKIILERENEHEDEQDKRDGNMQVVASHYNELKETGRKERLKSRILHMRNFNNWIKSQLINEYLTRIKSQQRMGDPMRVLDMCCGKGGDLLKWEKANITHLICTDIAEISLEQCKKRYEDMMERASRQKFSHKFSAEFIPCDSTLTRLRERYKDPSLKLNLVSCQFAFHYSFESLSQADCMVRNAAECLQPGGYFIATMPDANEIMRRLRDSSNGRSFGNEIYNIEFVSDTDPPPLFGAKYTFHLEGVVDCPEFLVFFPAMVKLCRKYGLKLERKTTFAEYFTESLPKGRTLLQRMNGMEAVQPKSINLNDEDYAHMKSVAKPSNMSRSYGTLSKSEWEATTLYLVCAFRKCKNTWDSEGKPVFEFD